MKNLYYLSFILIAFTSCKKSTLTGDNGCISRVKQVNFGIKSSDSVIAIALLKQNGIAYSNLQLSFVSLDTVPEGPNQGIYQNVFAVQNVNGLPILSSHIWYQFENSTLQSTTGTKYTSGGIFGGSSLSLPQLRELYLKAATANHAAVSFKDSCLVAQFGYYDLNVTAGGAPNLVKAWSVTQKNYNAYPRIYFRDDNGATILYDGGAYLDDAGRLKQKAIQ